MQTLPKYSSCTALIDKQVFKKLSCQSLCGLRTDDLWLRHMYGIGTMSDSLGLKEGCKQMEKPLISRMEQELT